MFWSCVTTLNLLFSNVLARFTNSKNLSGTMWKKKYKDYNILLMCITKDNLFKTKIVRFVWCVTQCTLSMYKLSCSYICVIIQIWMLWSTKSSSHPKQIHLEDMLLLERPSKVAMASTIIILMLSKVAHTSTFLNVNKIRKHCHFFIT